MQKGLEGTKKLIQQLESSQRHQDVDKCSQNHGADQKSLNRLEPLRGSASDRRLVFDDSIAVDGFEEQNRKVNQSTIVDGLQDLSKTTILDG